MASSGIKVANFLAGVTRDITAEPSVDSGVSHEVSFCVIVVLSLIKSCLSAGWRCRQNHGYDVIDDDDFVHERIADLTLKLLISQ